GAIFYHPGYTANPLVYCGSLGILPVGSHPTDPQAGDLVVALGGRTGRDGLRGATFSSMEMDTSTSEIAGTAVQIGHPIMEKQVQEVILKARDAKLYTAITDCGAGGFSSAVGEMSEKLGASIQLKNIQLKYPGLRPWEIWLSEAQERMVLSVPKENLAALEAICAEQDVEATVLGEFTGDRRLQILYGERLVGDLSESFLHDGLPNRKMKAIWSAPEKPSETVDLSLSNALSDEEALLKLLAHPNISSREETIRLYDHEVQAGTAVKPLVGEMGNGPGDAAVIVPLDSQPGQQVDRQHRFKGVAISNGICPQFAAVDPYKMAWAAVDEAIRNAVAVGGDPDQVAILDNFCWGNPNLPDRLGSLVRCSQGCYDASIAYQAPFISGKDSLNNEYTGANGEKHAIPGTLLVSAIAMLDDVEKTVTMDFKTPGDLIYLVGETGNHLRQSHYESVFGGALIDSEMPTPLADPLKRYRAIHKAIQAGIVTAAHDCSEGGLAVALAEMALASDLGADIGLDGMLNLDEETGSLPTSTKLFAESIGRLVLTVSVDVVDQLEEIFDGLPLAEIGTVTQRQTLSIADGDGDGKTISLEVDQLRSAFVNEHVTREDGLSGEKESASYHPQVLKKSPKVLVLHANGTNRDRDVALACELSGGDPEIVHLNQIFNGDRAIKEYHMLVLPGGFSYGDDLGAGVLWASNLRHQLNTAITDFVADRRPVIGICNGFQVLVKAGVFEGALTADRQSTLTYNEQGRFECRWVSLRPNPASRSIFTQGLEKPIVCPVAHGEGRFLSANLEQLESNEMVALTYETESNAYPQNPNGSFKNIAGISNQAGNVLGLMPHPENHLFPWQHPTFHRGTAGHSGLVLFKNGLKYAGG
ncbi:MAG: phosphoribosylformylglycinamidine synthase I, partial [Chloroflexota bacterium]